MTIKQRRFRVVCVGDSSTGKSTLLRKIATNQFSHESHPTIGVDFFNKPYIAPDGSACAIQLWDTAGRQSFRQITQSYFQGADAFLLVFDVTREQSFQGISLWLTDILSSTHFQHAQTPLFLVGTHIDKATQRMISFEEAAQFALEKGLFYAEVSSLTGEGITALLDRLLLNLYGTQKKAVWLEEQETDTINLVPRPHKRTWSEWFCSLVCPF